MTQEDLPSLRISDIARQSREDYTPPVEHRDMTQPQRAVLHAYWRARSVRYAGLRPSLRAVESYCTEDIGYGTVAKTQVKHVIRQLRELGWPIVEMPEEEKKPEAVRPAKEKKVDPILRAAQLQAEAAGVVDPRLKKISVA